MKKFKGLRFFQLHDYKYNFIIMNVSWIFYRFVVVYCNAFKTLTDKQKIKEMGDLRIESETSTNTMMESGQ